MNKKTKNYEHGILMWLTFGPKKSPYGTPLNLSEWWSCKQTTKPKPPIQIPFPQKKQKNKKKHTHTCHLYFPLFILLKKCKNTLNTTQANS